jgi:hypothetical protein
MVDKVNGKAMPDQHLTGSLQYVSISLTTASPMVLIASPANNAEKLANIVAQKNLDALVQCVSQRSQPVILGAPVGAAPSINVAFGHVDVWPTVTAGNVTSLKANIDALQCWVVDSTATVEEQIAGKGAYTGAAFVATVTVQSF